MFRYRKRSPINLRLKADGLLQYARLSLHVARGWIKRLDQQLALIAHVQQVARLGKADAGVAQHHEFLLELVERTHVDAALGVVLGKIAAPKQKVVAVRQKYRPAMGCFRAVEDLFREHLAVAAVGVHPPQRPASVERVDDYVARSPASAARRCAHRCERLWRPACRSHLHELAT